MSEVKEAFEKWWNEDFLEGQEPEKCDLDIKLQYQGVWEAAQSAQYAKTLKLVENVMQSVIDLEFLMEHVKWDDPATDKRMKAEISGNTKQTAEALAALEDKP